jgi:hypothetical protein
MAWNMGHGAWGEARKARNARKARQGAGDRTQLAGSSGQQTEVGSQKSEIKRIIVVGVCK